jgi:hypothetical protein
MSATRIVPGMRVEGDELPPTARLRPRRKPAPKATSYGPSRHTRERLAFLQANAGQWCRLAECEPADNPEYRRMLSLATSWRQSGRYEGCEFAVRTTGGKRVLFGRFVAPVEG